MSLFKVPVTSPRGVQEWLCVDCEWYVWTRPKRKQLFWESHALGYSTWKGPHSPGPLGFSGEDDLRQTRELPPAWVPLKSSVWLTAEASDWRAVGFGYPARAVLSVSATDDRGYDRGMLTVRVFSRSWRLSILPIVSGLAINGACIFVIVVSSQIICASLRREMRRRKGLCVKCGYLVGCELRRCPECGCRVLPRKSSRGVPGAPDS